MPRSVQRSLEVSRGVQRCQELFKCLEESRYVLRCPSCSKVPAGVQMCLEMLKCSEVFKGV